MPTFKRPANVRTPSQLSDEITAAQADRDAALKAANDAFAAKRDAVIDEACTRDASLAALEEEIRQERELLLGVIARHTPATDSLDEQA